jgi:hypothetical protein
MAVRDLERARTVYGDIRAYWVAKGSALEAHERLSAVTVAAGLRDFAFLTHIDAEVQPSITDLIRRNGLLAEPCSSAFDIDIEPEGIAAATVEVYKRAQRESRPLSGLGLWSPHLSACVGMTALGGALSYPPCCEMMDLRTKQRDHELFLASIVEEEGDEPARVKQALLERREYSKASYDHCHEWNDRFAQTLSRFPFVLHTACDDCLQVDQSPTANLNREYEDLAASVSPELHLMVRWGARALSYRPDQG